MKHIIFTLIIILFSLFQTKAQNSGYMGKHIIISSEGTFSGSYFFMKKTWLKYGGTIEFVVGKRNSLGFGFLHNKTKFPYSSAQYDNYKYYENNSELISNTFAVDYYKYFDGNIAPLGDFVRIRVFYMLNHSDDFYDNRVFVGQSKSSSQYVSTIDEYNNFGASFFFGRKRIYNNFLSVAFGFKLGIALINPFITESNYYPNYGNEALKGFGIYEDFYSTTVALNVNIGFVL